MRALVLLALSCLTLPTWAEPEKNLVTVRRPLARQILDARAAALQPRYGSSAPVVSRWKNPSAGQEGVLVRGGLPEGLCVLGPDGQPTDRLDLNKGIALYVHGWAPEGLPEFPHPELWHAKGFNTLVFRWHERAHQPFLAAHNLAESGLIADELAAALLKLRQVLDQGELGSYRGEIRLIGYSLGAVPVLQAAHKVFYADSRYAGLDWRRRYPRRIDLLEPAFVTHFMQADQVIVDRRSQVLTPVQISKNSVALANRLEGWGVHVVAFTSVLPRYFTPNLERTMLTQELSSKWQPTAKEPNILDQHVEIVDYYFRSIGEPPPRLAKGRGRALSASTPTAELATRPRANLLQVEGQKTLTPGDDVYVQRNVESTRGGVLVDHNPAYTENRTLDNTLITVPVWQRGY
jgi:hypothetical protein